jgi:hypothetical protein
LQPSCWSELLRPIEEISKLNLAHHLACTMNLLRTLVLCAAADVTVVAGKSSNEDVDADRYGRFMMYYLIQCVQVLMYS